jgi:hypothetical protein
VGQQGGQIPEVEQQQLARKGKSQSKALLPPRGRLGGRGSRRSSTGSTASRSSSGAREPRDAPAIQPWGDSFFLGSRQNRREVLLLCF